ncbi:MAG: hypothetical protein HQL17_00455 [Candidatus Omnitrophica bacterium]|nr:hypothetical protein [Candidatus Omnitrophota bacterium]
MHKPLLIGLLTLIFSAPLNSCHAQMTSAALTIDITAQKDIQDATTLSDAVDALSAKVSACFTQKTASAGECLCLYPGELQHVKKTYTETLGRHPDWQDKVVAWRDESRTRSFMISLMGVRRTLEKDCPK